MVLTQLGDVGRHHADDVRAPERVRIVKLDRAHFGARAGRRRCGGPARLRLLLHVDGLVVNVGFG